MGDKYFSLKKKLEELGYNYNLPLQAVPLVECVLSDLLQTTRSLQHFMELSKDALLQRDSLVMESEPYKCDNTRLIQENNRLHKDVMLLQEETRKISREDKRKINSLSDELVKKDNLISKLQHDLRDLSLRGLCAGTHSSRNKSKRRGAGDEVLKSCVCSETQTNQKKDNVELFNKIKALEEKLQANYDEINLLKNQVDNRDDEIIRLNMLLEGGRTLNKDNCNVSSDARVKGLMKQVKELKNMNDILKKQLDAGLEKQHEAMLRALSLADKNKALEDELRKVDTLALKVEQDCNKRLGTLMNDVNLLQLRIDELVIKNKQLEIEISNKSTNSGNRDVFRLQESLNFSMKEKEKLHNDMRELVELNKSLQEKISSQSDTHAEYFKSKSIGKCDSQRYATKDELQSLLESERKMYEKYVQSLQDKITETMNSFNQHLSKCKDIDKQTETHRSTFIRDLNSRLCESEQRNLMLKKEIDDLQSKLLSHDENNRQNYKDVISQLNDENAELSKENIALSQQLTHYKNIGSVRNTERGDYVRRDVENLKCEIKKLTSDTQILRKDKHEYNLRYREAMDLVDKYKRDLIMKQKEIEQLNEENNSYKMTHRTGKASADHLREECNFLREQIKKMQNDVIKEKTMASQIKNIQLETERSTNEMQNELLCSQKKNSVLKDEIDSLDKKCRDLQSEIISLKNEKFNLIENIKKVDQERDKLVLELDHKAEANCKLEHKLKSQTYEMNKLETEISDLNRKLNINKVSEHKVVDSEAQIKFLNGEITRLKHQYDNAAIENKHLQNSLADVNGTLKVTRIEYDKSRKEVDELRQQLQHYVAEIRRIEELLSHKEAERSDMLEHFASLSVEANILENTNHSLESESASKSLQLQNYVIKIQELESKLLDKDSIIESQSTRLAEFMCKVTALENEVKLITEEKIILQQNAAHLKQMYTSLQSEQKSVGETDSELKLYENRIKSLSNAKSKLELQNEELKDKLRTTEKLLSNSRNEIIELKLTLQDATSETKSLQDRIGSMRREETIEERTLIQDEFELPLLLEETIHEVSQEEDEAGSSYREVHKRFSKYGHHGSTL